MPELPTPVRPPELESTADARRASLEGEYPLDALAIRCAVGNEAWNGRTTLAARGSGAVEVTFQQGGQHSTWSSTWTPDEFLPLVQLLANHQVWSIQGQRQAGVPDEAYTTATVEAEGFEPLRAGMWAGEAQQDPDFRPIVDVLAGLAQRISGGVAK